MTDKREYTTERGITIGITPIPLLLDKIREAHEMPRPPTYTETLIGGVKQEVEITPQMAAAWAKEDPDAWAEHAEAWAEYQAELDQRTSTMNDMLWRAVMRQAIQVELPEDDAWAENQADYGLTVPDEPKARREHYIWTEVLGGQRDIISVMALAAGAALTEEQISAAEASFLDTLQRPGAA
jgi:hypothetical protein